MQCIQMARNLQKSAFRDMAWLVGGIDKIRCTYSNHSRMGTAGYLLYQSPIPGSVKYLRLLDQSVIPLLYISRILLPSYVLFPVSHSSFRPHQTGEI